MNIDSRYLSIKLHKHWPFIFKVSTSCVKPYASKYKTIQAYNIDIKVSKYISIDNKYLCIQQDEHRLDI